MAVHRKPLGASPDGFGLVLHLDVPPITNVQRDGAAGGRAAVPGVHFLEEVFASARLPTRGVSGLWFSAGDEMGFYRYGTTARTRAPHARSPLTTQENCSSAVHLPRTAGSRLLRRSRVGLSGLLISLMCVHVGALRFLNSAGWRHLRCHIGVTGRAFRDWPAFFIRTPPGSHALAFLPPTTTNTVIAVPACGGCVSRRVNALFAHLWRRRFLVELISSS